jgi:hypothetical protein
MEGLLEFIRYWAREFVGISVILDWGLCVDSRYVGRSSIRAQGLMEVVVYD